MSFAIRKDGQGWRAINSESDCMPDENFSVMQQGPIIPSKISRINELQYQYEIDRDKLNRAWLSAIIADGAGEVARKAIISTQMTALKNQLQLDINLVIQGE